jgi:FtsX-like permease family
VAQSIAGRQDEVTTIPIELSVGTRPSTIKQLLAKRYPGVSIIADGEEPIRLGANGDLVSKAALVIAVLALVIGGIGVMNTELMAVIERRSEFAILSAVGWSARQIAWRVLIEGIVTTFLGAIIGLLLGVIGAHYLVKILGASEFVTPHITPWALGRALPIGVLIGVLGGLYPAWRAAHVAGAGARPALTAHGAPLRLKADGPKVRDVVEAVQLPATVGETHDARDRSVLRVQEGERPASGHLVARLGDDPSVHDGDDPAARGAGVGHSCQAATDALGQLLHRLGVRDHVPAAELEHPADHGSLIWVAAEESLPVTQVDLAQVGFDPRLDSQLARQRRRRLQGPAQRRHEQRSQGRAAQPHGQRRRLSAPELAQIGIAVGADHVVRSGRLIRRAVIDRPVPRQDHLDRTVRQHERSLWITGHQPRG